MGVQVAVDFEQMHALLDVLMTTLSDMQAAGATLDGESATLLAAWKGEAADGYDARHRAWQLDHGYSIEELSQAIKLLQRVTERYEQAEASIMDLVG